MVQKADLEVLLSEEELKIKIKELAKQISQDYKGSDHIVLVGILKGAFIFLADLMREIEVDCQVEFIRLASYHSGTTSSGEVKSIDLTLPDLADQDVLIIEDIIDSGRTARFLFNFFQNQSKARSVKLVTLFDKPCRRIDELKDLKPDYCCFEIEDKFIVGYGLDYEQQFRDLPYIGYLPN